MNPRSVRAEEVAVGGVVVHGPDDLVGGDLLVAGPVDGEEVFRPEEGVEGPLVLSVLPHIGLPRAVRRHHRAAVGLALFHTGVTVSGVEATIMMSTLLLLMRSPAT